MPARNVGREHLCILLGFIMQHTWWWHIVSQDCFHLSPTIPPPPLLLLNPSPCLPSSSSYLSSQHQRPRYDHDGINGQAEGWTHISGGCRCLSAVLGWNGLHARDGGDPPVSRHSPLVHWSWSRWSDAVHYMQTDGHTSKVTVAPVNFKVVYFLVVLLVQLSTHESPAYHIQCKFYSYWE